jgi:Zn-dependent protease with chaperone function
VVAVLFQPLVYDPLFNHFTRLPPTQLRTSLLALAARAHVPAKDVYVADMSHKTHKVNAYMTGVGSSQRIVLWDTTLQQLQPDEILDVMGHEMGHYVLGHIWKGLLLGVLGAFIAFRLVSWLMAACIAAFGPAWGLRGVSDLASFPLLVALLGVASFVGAPVTNAISREIEHQADVFSLELTHDNDASARSFLKLAEDNKSDPEPAAWVKWWIYSHPPLGERIRFALGYHPWAEGRPNRFYRE